MGTVLARREFPKQEYERRWTAAQNAMRVTDLDAIIVASPASYRYFSGHCSQFWSTVDRPRLCVIPREGEPSLLITSLEEDSAREGSWITSLLFHQREGFSAFSDNVGTGAHEIAKNLERLELKNKKVGMELGPETRIGLSYADINLIRDEICGTFVDASKIIWKARLQKSPAEIEKLRRSVSILDNAFERAFSQVALGMNELEIARLLSESIFEQGGESMPFLYFQSAKGFEELPFRGPVDRKLNAGDLLYIDCGSSFEGYKSDYCRMVSVGESLPSDRLYYRRIHELLHDSISCLGPGVKIQNVVDRIDSVLARLGFVTSDLAVRYGHSIGLEVGEPPTITRATGGLELQPGTVLCLEPGALVEGRFYQLEEMVLITDDGFEILSNPAPASLQVVGG